MKKTVVFCSLFLALLLVAPSAHAANPVKIDVLYMNHGPLKETLSKMKAVFSSYGDRLSVSWYEFESQEGEQFKAKKGIDQHVPLMVWVDGKTSSPVGARQVTFSGFPSGSGPASFQGKWTMDDLKAALDQATGKR